MGKQVPLVIYDHRGERTVVGMVEVDGNEIKGTIINEALATKISDLKHCSYSISPEQTVLVTDEAQTKLDFSGTVGFE